MFEEEREKSSTLIKQIMLWKYSDWCRTVRKHVSLSLQWTSEACFSATRGESVQPTIKNNQLILAVKHKSEVSSQSAGISTCRKSYTHPVF